MDLLEIDTITTDAAVKEAIVLTAPKENWVHLVIEYGFALYWLVPCLIVGWFGCRGLVGYSVGPERDIPRLMFSGVMVTVPLCVAAFILRQVVEMKNAKLSLLGSVRFVFTTTPVQIS